MQQLSFLDQLRSNQENILYAAEFLSRAARRNHCLARWSKISVIFLGAIAASPIITSDYWPGEPQQLLIITSIIAFLMAIVSGLEMAFGFEAKASELRTLSAGCAAAAIRLDHEFHEFTSRHGNVSQLQVGAPGFVELERLHGVGREQTSLLEDISKSAAACGVDLSGAIMRKFAGKFM